MIDPNLVFPYIFSYIDTRTSVKKLGIIYSNEQEMERIKLARPDYEHSKDNHHYRLYTNKFIIP